ncbi:unnamed protein product [Rhizoctonia solani]|uniref:Uncharacterized protein n=1 Tax=Rhizoctonia solani TaxID=456999 RepID=A0A8H3I5Y9_9AGAM|nr:unnamed protein product [Rhizoctonia solani]CAE7227009.1 unnamed protein product [Rhizoctonia solani]
MYNFQEDIFPVPALKRVLLDPIDPPHLFASQWVYGIRTFSDWIEGCYENNKGSLSYGFGVKLEKAVRAIKEHEKRLVSKVTNDPVYANPFSAYNGYVAALADITAYMQRLPLEEQKQPFLLTLANTFEQRRQISLELAEARSGKSITGRA